MKRIPFDTLHGHPRGNGHLPHDHAHHHDGDHGFGQGRGFGPGLPGGPGFGPGGFGPGGFGPRGRGRAGRGDIRAAILSLLSDSPSNGYGLIKSIAERTGGVWRPSPGSVYPTLQQLVDEDLIASIGEGRRTEFELTDAGKAYVAEHAEELTKAWEATPGRSKADRAFTESVGKLMGVVQQFRGTTEAQRTAAIEKLDETRRALYLILAD